MLIKNPLIWDEGAEILDFSIRAPALPSSDFPWQLQVGFFLLLRFLLVAASSGGRDVSGWNIGNISGWNSWNISCFI